MWLEAFRKQMIVKYDPSDLVIAWSIDVKALGEASPINEFEPDEFLVGRIMADEVRLREVQECDEDVWSVTDADSAGLEAAWSSLLDKHGNLRFSEFERPFDSVVYLYRFALHPHFSSCRLAVVDAVCRTFGLDAVILAQRHTTWLADTEFDMLSFRLLPPTCVPAPGGFANIDRETRFMLRQNGTTERFSLSDYPEDTNAATAAHAEWVEGQGPWSDLV
jgi:hypothetical protein